MYLFFKNNFLLEQMVSVCVCDSSDLRWKRKRVKGINCERGDVCAANNIRDIKRPLALSGCHRLVFTVLHLPPAEVTSFPAMTCSSNTPNHSCWLLFYSQFKIRDNYWNLSIGSWNNLRSVFTRFYLTCKGLC